MLDWQIAPHFLIRSAGFPFARLETLACERAAASVDRLLAAEAALDAHAETLVARWQNYPKVPGLKRPSLIKTLAARQGFAPERVDLARALPELAQDMQDWNEAVAALAPLAAAVDEAVSDELAQARHALVTAFEEPRLREAVFLSSPSMYRNVLDRLPDPGDARDSRARRTERQLALYLQRFCAKNETTSFFGPINYGRIGRARQNDLPLSYDTAGDGERRIAFMAFWAVQALADAAAACPQVRRGLVPRLAAGCRLTGDGRLWIAARDRSVALTPAQRSLLERIAVGVTLGALDDGDETGTRVEDALRRFLDKRLVELSLPVPVQEVDALGWLARDLAARDAGGDAELRALRDGIDRLDALRDRFARADAADKARCLHEAEALFEKLTGEAPARQAGQIYADRTLFYEEATGTLRNATLDADAADDLQARLAPLLNLWALAGAQRAQYLSRLGARIYTTLYGDADGAVPFARFLNDVLRDERLPEWEAAAQNYRPPVEQRFAARLARDGARRCDADGTERLDLPPELIRAACDEAEMEDDAARHPFICSPDFMLETRADGSYRWVLGEVHDTAMVWGWALALHPDGETLQQDMWRYLSPIAGSHCANVAGRTRIKIIPFRYPGPTLEVSAAPEADADPEAEPGARIALADVVVRRLEGRVRLEHDGHPLVLYNGELPSLLHRIFALPRAVPFAIGDGARTPRVTMGDLVVQRAAWRVDRDALGLADGDARETAALFTALRRARRALGLPERVFARIPDQPKPVFIDFRSLHSAEILDALMPAQGQARLSEALPDGDGLWLDPGTGAHHTAEFRFTFAAPPRRRGQARRTDEEDLGHAAN